MVVAVAVAVEAADVAAAADAVEAAEAAADKGTVNEGN